MNPTTDKPAAQPGSHPSGSAKRRTIDCPECGRKVTVSLAGIHPHLRATERGRADRWGYCIARTYNPAAAFANAAGITVEDVRKFLATISPVNRNPAELLKTVNDFSALCAEQGHLISLAECVTLFRQALSQPPDQPC